MVESDGEGGEFVEGGGFGFGAAEEAVRVAVRRVGRGGVEEDEKEDGGGVVAGEEAGATLDGGAEVRHHEPFWGEGHGGGAEGEGAPGDVGV